MGLLLRNVVFTIVVPGTAGVLVPWMILTGGGGVPVAGFWPGYLPIAVGIGLYVWSVANFARVGRGTPGPWDPPRRVVATGPFRWVRNPMYIAVLLVVVGQGLLFESVAVVVYAVILAVVFHLFVIGYEEPTLHELFDGDYDDYRRAVPRWLPRPPR
jgi:protein-S-isoprenylcysteine O-methyltransferase Ste14